MDSQEAEVKFEEFNSKTSTKKSDVWKNFGFLIENGSTNKQKVVCKLCRLVIPYSGNTTNLHAHIDRNHWSSKEHKTIAQPRQKEKEQPTVTALFKNQQPLTRDSQRSVMITKAIANFLVIDMKPFGTIEGRGFKHMMAVIEPRYTVASRNHLVEKHIVPLYQKALVDVKKELSLATRHAFTTDAWTSLSMDSFITTTCHFINPETFELTAKVLDTKCVKMSHTGENLATEMKSISSRWGFKDPVAVTDNAANIVSGCRIAEYPHIGCFGHTLNLAVNKCMDVNEVSSLLGKCRKLVAVFKQSYMKTMSLHSAQAALELKELQVIQDVDTRWNSALAMVRRLLDILPAIWAVLYKESKYSHLLPSDTERKNMEDLQNLLIPIEKATVKVSSEKQTTASLIIPILQRLLNHDLIVKESDTTFIRKAKDSIRKDLLKRYQGEQEKTLLEMATVLDPRFKQLQWMDNEEKNSVYDRLKEEMMKIDILKPVVKQENMENQIEIDNEVHSASEPNMPQLDVEPRLPSLESSILPGASQLQSSPDRKKLKQGSPEGHQKSNLLQTSSVSEGDDFFDVLFVKEEQCSISKESLVVTELQRYKSELTIPSSQDPLEWWKVQRYTYPYLASLVVKYLHIPATSVPSERVFSKAGNILNKKRGALSAENADMLIFLHHNAKLDS